MNKPKNEGAIAVLFNAEGDRLLLVQRKDVAVWVLPGGGIDPGESPENAALREIFEETGIRAKIVRKVAEYTPINRLASPTHLYECVAIEGTPSLSNETRDVKYFSPGELPESLFFVHRDWIADTLARHAEVIRTPISQVTYGALLAYFLRHPFRLLRFLWTRLTKS